MKLLMALMLVMAGVAILTAPAAAQSVGPTVRPVAFPTPYPIARGPASIVPFMAVTFFFWVVGTLLSFVWATLCAVQAKAKNRGVVQWFLLGLVFGLFALATLSLMGPAPEPASAGFGPTGPAPAGGPKPPTDDTRETAIAHAAAAPISPGGDPVATGLGTDWSSAGLSPLAILQERYARGEIGEEEYQRMRATLRQDPLPASL